MMRMSRSIFEYQRSSGRRILRRPSDWCLTVKTSTSTSQPFKKASGLSPELGGNLLAPGQPAVTGAGPHADSEDLSSLLATESEPILERKVLADLRREGGRHC